MDDEDEKYFWFWPWAMASYFCMWPESWFVRIPLFVVAYIPAVMVSYVICAIGKVLEGMKH